MGAMLSLFGQLKRKARKERKGRNGTSFDYFLLVFLATFAYLALTTFA